MRNSLIIRLLLGVLFIISAAAKLWSIDLFELYVYSFRFFSLDLTFVLARLCIGAELAIGILLLTGWWRRFILTAALSMLFFFSFFLCYAALVGRNDSCQCFGQLADMPPAVSLLKNAILILLTLICLKKTGEYSNRRKLHKWLTVVLIASAMATPFIISVPDSWMFKTSHELYNYKALHEAIDGMVVENGVIDLNSHVIAFVTPGCPYCKMTRQKLDSMSKRLFLKPGAIVYVEPDDLADDMFLRITYGARPLILVLVDGEVVATYHYRNINERQIRKYLR